MYRQVIDSGPEAGKAPVIYWDGWAGLEDATLTTGVRATHVSGQVACRGYPRARAHRVARLGHRPPAQ